MNRALLILYTFMICCASLDCTCEAYPNADIHIKTIDGKDYSCKKCDISLEEGAHWTSDVFLIDDSVKKVRIKKSKISEIKIKIRQKDYTK